MRIRAAAGLLLLTACGGPTAILIELTSDLPVPDAVDTLDLRIDGVESGASLERSFLLDAPFPHTFSVLPARPMEPVVITVTARRGDQFVLRRVVRTTFRAGTEVVAPIELYEECVGVICADGIDCVAGRCTTEPPPEPDAGPPDVGPPGCTTDEECDDLDPCNGAEQCESGSCVSSGTADCDDGVACTDDDCRDAACLHTPDDAACAPGDSCDAAAGCGGRRCTGDADCDDGRACNGREHCAAGRCATDPPPDCDDAVACTTDRCDDGAGCVHTPDDFFCNDGFFCNGEERCMATGCTRLPAPTCDDGDACTDDDCGGPGTGSCLRATRDLDGDGHGDRACPVSGGLPADDCDDRVVTTHPGAPEICDGADQDCDTAMDEGCGGGCAGTCAGATRVDAPGGRFTVPLGASSSHRGSCGGDGPEAVLTFTLAASADLFVTTHGSAIDTVLYVRSCSCEGSEARCNDDADGAATSALSLPSLSAGTYTVIADTKTPMSASLSIDLYVTPPGRPGDRCGRPLPLSAMPLPGNTCGASNDLDGDCERPGSFEGDDHVYYVLVTGARRRIGFDTCSACTRFDSALDIRRVCDAGGTTARVACNDDSCRSSCVGGPRRQSSVAADLDPGLYYVVVDGREDECGDFILTPSGL